MLPAVNAINSQDGLYAGGRRLADYVREFVSPGCRLSFVGHSLGGLYCRIAVAMLFECGYFRQVSPSLRRLGMEQLGVGGFFGSKTV